ncbi:MAG: ATP phosphoribosyltransferase regulatory subunit [Boseongicola sp.]|nr:MAG: ATP phosphoribosyltransferase regulatory subunit [Boseongicola sp.]
MTLKSDIRAEADRLRATFQARGAEVFEPEILQPAGTLLGLYGEDIRARAFVTQDPIRGEMMLRPDFTVPLVQSHIEADRTSASYTYSGEIFRRQEDDDTRPTEYMQVGYEIFAGEDEATTDAEVLAAVSNALADLPLATTIGDFAILRAAINSLDTPDRRKAALLRHLWRPARFRALLQRFSRPAPPPPPAPDPNTPHVGLRSLEDIEVRRALLAQEAKTPPITDAEVTRLNAILSVRDKAPAALATLMSLANGDSDLANAVTRLQSRLDALADKGIAPDTLDFEASYGRTSMEYYGGFVFGLSAPDKLDWPVIATGGRYDLLTETLGQPIPAVGGVIRPDAVLALRGSTQ